MWFMKHSRAAKLCLQLRDTAVQGDGALSGDCPRSRQSMAKQ